MFTALTVVMVSWVFSYAQTHRAISIKYIQFSYVKKKWGKEIGELEENQEERKIFHSATCHKGQEARLCLHHLSPCQFSQRNFSQNVSLKAVHGCKIKKIMMQEKTKYHETGLKSIPLINTYREFYLGRISKTGATAQREDARRLFGFCFALFTAWYLLLKIY